MYACYCYNTLLLIKTALSFQYLDTAGWLTGRASGTCENTCSTTIPTTVHLRIGLAWTHSGSQADYTKPKGEQQQKKFILQQRNWHGLLLLLLLTKWLESATCYRRQMTHVWPIDKQLLVVHIQLWLLFPSFLVFRLRHNKYTVSKPKVTAMPHNSHDARQQSLCRQTWLSWVYHVKCAVIRDQRHYACSKHSTKRFCKASDHKRSSYYSFFCSVIAIFHLVPYSTLIWLPISCSVHDMASL